MTDANSPRDDVSTAESKRAIRREAITGGFSRNADLISYIVAGLIVGLGLDWLLGTSPIMVVIWTPLGLAVGYWRLWQQSESLEQEGKERSHGV